MEKENYGGNRLTQVHLEKWPLKRSVCVCVYCLHFDVNKNNIVDFTLVNFCGLLWIFGEKMDFTDIDLFTAAKTRKRLF